MVATSVSPRIHVEKPTGRFVCTVSVSFCLHVPRAIPSVPFTKVMTVRRELFGAFMSCCHFPVVYEVDEDGRFSTNYVISTAHPLTDTVVSSGNARSVRFDTVKLHDARASRDLPSRQIYRR